MSLKYHDAPGFVDDLTEANKKLWHAQFLMIGFPFGLTSDFHLNRSETISSFMLTSRVTPKLEPQFYDATKVFEKEPQSDAKITWIAFPKRVKIANPNDRKRWKAADADRNVQDEYCEWSIKRDNSGKMLKVVFCNEGPEYYEFLGEHQPETLVDLYRKLNPGFDINSQDLFHKEGGKLVYNPLNKWNNRTDTGSIMHLIQPANTLGAEIDLGALATVLRKRADGTPITDPDELVRCGKYGNPDRNSDPHIGAEVNTIARSGAMVTIKNPVGLYIDNINWGQIETPDGDDPSKWWKWTRGREGTYMRAEFEVPEDKPYVLGDLLVKGIPLDFGGQLADYISISLTGHASDMDGKNQIKPRLCSDPPPNPSAASEVNISNSKQFTRHV
ncbi:hypothetical protein CVT25_000785 [Psilocybe cyanescens]|uniref:Uncharacterized protein n=1 Tax=Psilocybe cyanescens TaxID=93625 RepID=A0A409XY79_PSICY|nr:hypothetical protein CVT25_000785 [Psilocybe cyanescens]